MRIIAFIVILSLLGCAKSVDHSDPFLQHDTFDYFKSGWLPSVATSNDTISNDTISDDTSSNTTNAGVIVAQTLEINMTASQWSFDPAEIRVHKGDRVIIHITALDVSHGIQVYGYKEHVELQPNETKTLDFIASKSGKFEYYCNIFCGAGHERMYGWLIVE